MPTHCSLLTNTAGTNLLGLQQQRVADRRVVSPDATDCEDEVGALDNLRYGGPGHGTPVGAHEAGILLGEHALGIRQLRNCELNRKKQEFGRACSSLCWKSLTDMYFIRYEYYYFSYLRCISELEDCRLDSRITNTRANKQYHLGSGVEDFGGGIYSSLQ